MKKEMLINVLQPEEIRIAIIEDGLLEELYVERTSRESYVGNIYKGRIVNIEPSIQAAFVDFGVGRNGFLHVSDVEPSYYRHLEEGREGRERGRGDRDRDRGDRDRDYDRRGGGGGRRGGRRPPDPIEERPLPDIASLDDDESVDLAEQIADVAERMGPIDEICEPFAGDLPDLPALDQGFEENGTGENLEDLDEDEQQPGLQRQSEPQDSGAGAPGSWTGVPPGWSGPEGGPPVGHDPVEKIEMSVSPVGHDPVEKVDTSVPPAAGPVPGKRGEEIGAETEIVEEEDSSAAAEAGAEGEEKEARGRTRRRGRGRGRGKGRGKRGAEETPASDSPPSTEPGPAAEPGHQAASDAPPPGDDRPFPMSSAEHRTDDAKSTPISDEELSFSMAPPAREQRVEREMPEAPPAPPPPPPPPAPVMEKDPVVAEPPPASIDFLPDDMPPLRSATPPADLSESEAVGYRDLPTELPDLAEDGQQFEPHQDRSFERDHDAEGFEARPAPRRDDRPRDDRPRDDRPYDDRPRDDRRDDRRGRGGPRGGPSRGGRPGQGGGRPGFGRPGGSGGGRPGFGRPKPLIQDIFKRGQEVLVQVIKEGIGTKGPTLSTYISIAGRYLVLMPGLNRIGVSRKIDDEEARRRLREVLHDLQPPKGLGFIIRTAGLDRNRKELQRDLAYLSRLWQVVVRRIFKTKGPAEIYQESDMITRTIRDIFTSEIDTIWVDEKTAFDHAQEFLQVVMPRYASRIKHYADTEPMFHKYGIESEMDRIQRRHVPLPAGGSIVIDQTEALVAIDVNSGNFRADNNAEETAYQMNLQAAKEIARQLRLRDLGGVIVNDFIDMRDEKHRRGVERALREAVRRDRARTKILRISQFGIIEMTRQRIRPSLKRSVFQDCQHCHGTGQVKTVESMSIEVMRLLQLAAHRDTLNRIEARVHEEVAFYLLNRKRAEIARLEEASTKQFFIQGKAGVSPEFMELLCYDNNNNEVKFLPYDEPVRTPRRRS